MKHLLYNFEEPFLYSVGSRFTREIYAHKKDTRHLEEGTYMGTGVKGVASTYMFMIDTGRKRTLV